MNWLLKNEKEGLKEIIKNSISKGLAQEIKNLDYNIDNQDFLNNNDTINDTILDFLYFMEESLLENIKNQNKNSENKDLNLKEFNNVLYSQLIKNWRPNKKEPVN